MNYLARLATTSCLLWSAAVHGADSVTAPRPIPLTRPEMKHLLEDLKDRKPRISLPELNADEKARLGNRADDYEYRLRYHYLPRTDGRGSVSFGGSDPNMTLDYAFKTMMFWIVSRTNNCQYCLGHQEIKLAVAGLEEDRVAALDSDWGQFTPAQQAAFAFARKLTFEPHRLSDSDIENLRQHYTDLQILEIVLSVSGNNSINRWKEGVGVPQSRDGRGFLRRSTTANTKDRVLPIETFLTPTAARYQDAVSKVAPIDRDEATGKLTNLALSRRPPLESRADVERKLADCRQRKPRLPVLGQTEARLVLAEETSDESLPQWVRLLANFPRDGTSKIRSLYTAEQAADLAPLLKAQVSWIVARQDRAWYATAESLARLKKLGMNDDRIYALDGSWESFTPAEQSLFTVARKLAASPILLTDSDVTAAIEATSPAEVVQLISYVTNRAFFNRVTEAAGLPADE